MVKSIGFDRFMTSIFDRFMTSILAFTSKTGQYVAHTRHKIFKNSFFYQVKDALRHLIGVISEPRF